MKAALKDTQDWLSLTNLKIFMSKASYFDSSSETVSDV